MQLITAGCKIDCNFYNISLRVLIIQFIENVAYSVNIQYVSEAMFSRESCVTHSTYDC